MAARGGAGGPSDGDKPVKKGAASVKSDPEAMFKLPSNFEVTVILGTSHLGKTSAGSSIGLWRKVSGKQPGTCSKVGCTFPGATGAHVKLHGRVGVHWYIIPMCRKCNQAKLHVKHEKVRVVADTIAVKETRDTLLDHIMSWAAHIK